jgi:hypothetical protein
LLRPPTALPVATEKEAERSAAKEKLFADIDAAKVKHAEFLAKEAAEAPERARRRSEWEESERARKRLRRRELEEKRFLANPELKEIKNARRTERMRRWRAENPAGGMSGDRPIPKKPRLKTSARSNGQGRGEPPHNWPPIAQTGGIGVSGVRGLGTKTIEIRKKIKEILERIHPASVRAVCYKLFTRQLIANMSKGCTNSVGKHLVTLRENGGTDGVPWAWVVDETREIERVACWQNLLDNYNSNSQAYSRDHWQDQPERVIICSEKGTVRGTLQPVLDELKVPLLVGHGYNSATVAHDVAELSRRRPRPLQLLYVGDHDPSGMHMSEV